MANQSNFLLFLTLISASFAVTRAQTRNNRDALSRKRLSPTEIHSREVKNDKNINILLQSHHEAIFDQYFGRAAIESQPSLSSKHPYEFSMSMSYTYSMSMPMSYVSDYGLSFSLSMSLSMQDNPSTSASSQAPTRSSLTNVPTAMLTGVPTESPTSILAQQGSSSPSKSNSLLPFSNDPPEEQMTTTNTTDLSRSDPKGPTSPSDQETMPTAIIPMMGGLLALLFMFGITATRKFENATNPLEYQDIGGDAHSEFSLTHGSLENVPL
jgi:hypothetical protein